MYCGDKLTVREDELCGALRSGDMGIIKRRKMQEGKEVEEEEGVQQGDKMKSSCGNGSRHERKEKVISRSGNP